MAPTLYSMIFSVKLTYAYQKTGFSVRYRFDGKLFNLRRLQAKSKVQAGVLDKLLNAIDLAEKAKTEGKGLWIECHKHVTTMTLQSAQKDGGCISARILKVIQSTNHHCK